MRFLHFVRFGSLGHVGRFTADGVRFPRSSRVVLRTQRGLELGEVLVPPGADSAAGPSSGGPPAPGQSDGAILRGLTVEDDLLVTRLAKNREAAFDACQARIVGLDLSVTLMDVEHLFDGQTLVFYFLGQQLPELAKITDELAELYDAQVQFRSFVAAATAGCGPGCGTDEAAGCGSCSTGCAIADACNSRKAVAAN